MASAWRGCVMLGVFFLVSLANGFQWVQFAIIPESVAWYYGVPVDAVTWTALLYMLAYTPCILPASWMLQRKGLRWTVVAAALGNCVAAWLKLAAVRPDLYAVLMAGQAVAAITQGFVLSVPPCLAATWFRSDHVATACAVGVIGNQVGNALGFVLPSLLVKLPSELGADAGPEEVGVGLRLVGYIVAAFTTVSLLLVLTVFEASPRQSPRRPSTQDGAGGAAGGLAYAETLRLLFTNAGFLYLLGAYSISTGVCFAASILLGQLISAVFPGSDDAGIIGLVMVFAGLLGSIVCGLLLDATAKYKEVTVGVYFLSVASIVVFTASLFAGPVWPVYLTGALAGFALAGYVPVGFEFGAELTHPVPEGTSAGALSAGAQLVGTALVLGCQRLLEAEARGWLWTCVALNAVLVLGAALTVAIPNRLLRKEAQQHDLSADD